MLGPATWVAVQALENHLIETDAALLVACSGGADSTALAVASLEVSRRRRLPVAVVVVDHGLQSDSERVSARVVENLIERGLTDSTVIRARVERRGSGLEAAARDARYQVLERSASERQATVLLGHTVDDQAETVLLGLARGSGVRSLAGMRPRRGCFLRPFLELRRATTAAVCAESGIEPWTDPHNADPAFARVRVRDRVMPLLETELGPGVAEALARTAQLAREDADLLDELARQVPGTGAEELDCEGLAGLPTALRSRVLRNWLAGRGVVDLQATHLRSVDRLVTEWHGQRRVEVPGAAVRRIGGRLVVGPPVAG